MLAPITHILPVTLIRRERILPVAGKVLVRAGQSVGATDVIAEANLNPEHLLLDVARGLGVPNDRVDKYIQCQEGDQLAEGDTLAGPVGLANRVVRSPKDGQVILVGSGQVLIEVVSDPYQVRAGIPGEVVELVGERGAVVETTGALIQGVWGNGHIDFGVMLIQCQAPDDVLSADQLDVSLRGSIVLGSHCQDPEVLINAAELPLRGLIFASMSAALVPLAIKTQLPIIVIEGFGSKPMDSIAFKLLTTNERREVALNAERWDPYKGTRPEIVIPLPGTENLSPPLEMDFFTPDQQVRIVRAPYAGVVGVLIKLVGLVVFPSGLRAHAAEVKLESGNRAIVPLANLEVIA